MKNIDIDKLGNLAGGSIGMYSFSHLDTWTEKIVMLRAGVGRWPWLSRSKV